MTTPAKVLRFSAGGLSAAVSAEHVAAIDSGDFGAPHIGAILGIETTDSSAEHRTVYVRHRERSLAFVVDEPVAIAELRRENIRPITGLDASAFPEFLLGFANDRGVLVALLDLGRIASRLEVTEDMREEEE